MDYGDSVDEWASTKEDDDFCYGCDDWTEDDGHGNCKDCGNKYSTVDPFISPKTAKVYSSPAPSVSSHGDVWNRGGGYTWGTGTSWWGGGSGSYTSMWGGGWSQSNTDREARMLKHKRHLDSLCKVVDPNVKHVLNFATDKSYSNMGNGQIYVDGSLLRDNDDKLDVVAGLSIHEKLHLVHTPPLVKWEKDMRFKHSMSGPQSKLLHNIGNIIEDEYIESQLAKTHAGYVDYIMKVKEHYFAEHGEKIDGAKNEFGDVLNTLLAMVRYPEAITPERRKKHAQHIRFFARVLKDALTNRENTLVAIETLYDYMYQLAEKEAKKSESLDEEAMMERAMKNLDDILSSYEERGVSDELSDKDVESMLDRLLQSEKESAKRHDRHGPHRVIRQGLEDSPTELVDYERAMDSISASLDKAIRDLAAGRGDAKTHISKIIYYGAVQNIIFNSLQSAMFALAFADDEEDDEDKMTEAQKKKTARVANNMVDSLLRGLGVQGAAVATVKNMIIKFLDQEKRGYRADHAYTLIEGLNISPPIGSKARKVYSATQSYKFNRDAIKEMGFDINSPAYEAVGNIVSGTTNVPLDRVISNINNIRGAMDKNNAAWQRVSTLLGWNRWDVGIPNRELERVKAEIKKKKAEEKKRKKEKK